MGGYWVVYKITSGCVVERTKVWRSGALPAKRRERVKGSSTLKKLDANLRCAVKKLARILNANFTEKDVLVKLSFEELPEDWRGREKSVAAFLRKLRRRFTGAGVTMKWISVDSEVDGATGKPARPHVHLVLSGGIITFREGHWWIGDETLDELWGLGGVWAEPLRRMSDYTPLALYLVRQAGRQAGRQKWHSSRNMTKPTVERTVVLTDRELRAPAGAVVTEKVYAPEQGINYVRYIQREKTKRDDGTGDAGRKVRRRE